jgi:hypothetical protein
VPETRIQCTCCVLPAVGARRATSSRYGSAHRSTGANCWTVVLSIAVLLPSLK